MANNSFWVTSFIIIPLVVNVRTSLFLISDRFKPHMHLNIHSQNVPEHVNLPPENFLFAAAHCTLIFVFSFT